MEQKNYNGFASEEQYEEAMNIIKNAIDEYTSTVMVEKKKTSIAVTIWTKTNQYMVRYWMDSDGVFRVDVDANCMASEECKIMVAINEKAGEIFKVMEG